jgi:hypothetical protein
MSVRLWMLIVLLGLAKLPLAAWLLWRPFRDDHAMDVPAPDDADAPEDDGGSRALPGGPLEPHPRTPLRHGPSPRRGPHGAPEPGSPRRVRHESPSRGVRRREVAG